jgi:hypothetical protein
MTEYGMETCTISQQEKFQKPTIHRKTEAYSFLRLTKPSTGTSSGEGYDNKL